MKIYKYLLMSALFVGAVATDVDAQQVKNLSGKVTEIFDGKPEVMVGVNILLILFGMFLDDSSAMYICAPILTPVLAESGSIHDAFARNFSECRPLRSGVI